MKARSLALALAMGVLLGLLPILPVGLEPAWAHHATSPVEFTEADASSVIEQPFTIVGFSWDGTAPEEVWFRSRLGDDEWSAWEELHLADSHAPDIGSREYEGHRPSTDPVWVGEQDQVQFRVVGSHEGATATLVDTTNRTKPFLRTIRDELTPRFPAADASHPGQPSINPRSSWDPFDSCQAPDHDPPEYVQVTQLFIHHTTSSNFYAQSSVPSMIAGICSFHVNTNGWNDIGYNVLVDRFGGIWEGRYGGVERGVSGAHAQGFNTYSAGIALLGSFGSSAPAAAQINALEDFIAWKSGVHNLDPTGATAVVSKGSNRPGFEQGVRVTLPTILGHRAAVATSCPGNACYALIPGIRQEVGTRWTPLIDRYVEPRMGDFNGDGNEDGLVLDPDTGAWWFADEAGTIGTWATLSPTTGWDHHLTGDFNGDGRTDLASFRNGTWWVHRSQGSTSAAAANWGTLSPSSGWTDHLVGDFDGDGDDDIASYRNGAWTVARSTGSSFSLSSWGTLSPTTGWDSHHIGDFNGDGDDDIASYRSAEEAWALLPADGSVAGDQVDAEAPTWDHWSLRFVHDWDSDGTEELMMLDAYDGTWEQGTFDGAELVFRTLEDTPYRNFVFRDTSVRGSGPFVTFFGQEYRWLRTEIGDGLGNSGEVPVERLQGPDRYATAAAASQQGFPDGADVVYVATGENFPDALAGGVNAALENGPVLLTTASTLPAATRDEIVRLNPAEIVVVGGTSVVSSAVQSSLAAIAPVTRIFGATRIETATELSRRAFPVGAPVVYIATGYDYPDALVTVPVAAQNGGPILLTAPWGLDISTRQEILRLDPDEIIIVGGTGAVGPVVESALEDLNIPVRRIAGADRYRTGVLIADEAPSDSTDVFVAVGTNFPDALAGGPVAAVMGAPVLLVAPTVIPSATAAALVTLKPERVFVLGGAGAVSEELDDELASLPALGAATEDGVSQPQH